MATPMSPEWKKPSDVMKIHRRKKVVPRGYMSNRGSQNSPSQSQPENLLSPDKQRVKRKNPFGCSPRKGSPRKRAHLAAETITFRRESPRKKARLNFNQDSPRAPPGVLMDVLNKKDRFLFGEEKASPKKNTKKPVPENLPDTADDIGCKLLSQSSTEEVPDEEEKFDHPKFPKDWSLKMKARFVSAESFAWCSTLKTLDEAKGMDRFIQQTSSVLDLKGQSPAQCKEAKAELHKCCLYWIHPNIPWLKLFPRMVTDSKIGKASAVLQDKMVLESLMDDWTLSFTSAFHLLRAGSCPYLYMCCHQFTVAFFAAKTRGKSQPMEAIITPTSRGFREALKSEGIEFSLPLQPKNDTDASPKSSKETSRETQQSANDTAHDTDKETEEPSASEGGGEDEEDEEDLDPAEDGAASWLETLGLDKRRYRSLDPSKVKLQRDGFRLIDNRPESTVHIQGADTQALFNFLLNCRSCVANTGIQAGIPPTLITPTAFKGATLKTLKVKQGNLRRQHADQPPRYSLEVLGPILPSAYTGLSQLFSATQADYTATFNVHEQTAATNVCTEGEDESSDGGELTLSVPLGREAIREVVCSRQRFTWTHY